MAKAKKPVKPLGKKDMKKTKGGAVTTTDKKSGQQDFLKITLNDIQITG
ncbi:MAG TPA: hypothetical protein VF950_25520 [Planctomycetota bacterium]